MRKSGNHVEGVSTFFISPVALRLYIRHCNTVGVIVPYEKEGEKLIEDLNGNCSAKQLKSYLKKAQQYSVNIFRDENSLEKYLRFGWVYILKNGGILAVNKEYYNEQFGVDFGEQGMKFLSC